jgi:hypothetical protein
MAGNPLIAAGQQLSGQNINVWLPALASANSPAGTELLLLEQAGRSRKFSLNALIAFLANTFALSSATVRAVAANYVVTLGDSIIEVNASGGAVTITYPPSLATGRMVTIVKTDASANAVQISDGASIVGYLVFPPVGASMQSQAVYSNGSALRLL